MKVSGAALFTFKNVVGAALLLSKCSGTVDAALIFYHKLKAALLAYMI
jgi:hypothetical protein